MRAVVQRVKDAWITVNGGEKQYMEQGLVVLFGVNDTDDAKDYAKDRNAYGKKGCDGISIFSAHDYIILSVEI